MRAVNHFGNEPDRRTSQGEFAGQVVSACRFIKLPEPRGRQRTGLSGAQLERRTTRSLPVQKREQNPDLRNDCLHAQKPPDGGSFYSPLHRHRQWSRETFNGSYSPGDSPFWDPADVLVPAVEKLGRRVERHSAPAVRNWSANRSPFHRAKLHVHGRSHSNGRQQPTRNETNELSLSSR
jgi:hypothetical protein